VPNWCSNAALFSHADPEKIDLLEENQDNLFKTMRPYEGEWSYDWCVTHWGTKWDADVHHVERIDDNTILMAFETAWSPPIELYRWTEYGVDAVFYEPSMEFAGRYNDGDERFYDTEDLEPFYAENPLAEWCV